MVNPERQAEIQAIIKETPEWAPSWIDHIESQLTEAQAQNKVLREALEDADTALANAMHGEEKGFARLSLGYAMSVFHKVHEALKNTSLYFHGEFAVLNGDAYKQTKEVNGD